MIASNSDIEVTPGRRVAELRELRRRAPALRDRRPAAPLPRRPLAALAPELPDGPRHARPPHAAPPRAATRRSGSATTTCSTSSPTEPALVRLVARRVPAPPPRDARRARRLRRGLPPLRRGHRPRLPRAQAGWERWYVPDAVVVHHHQAVTDRRFFTRRTLWHWRSIAPLRPQAPREPARALAAVRQPPRYPHRVPEPEGNDGTTVERVVLDLKDRVERARAAGEYADDLSGVELQTPSVPIVQGFDLEGAGPRSDSGQSWAFRLKPVIGPVITFVETHPLAPAASCVRRSRAADGHRDRTRRDGDRRRGGDTWSGWTIA